MKKNELLKRALYVAGLAGVMMGFNGCYTTGYIASEPVYIEYARPARPSNLHIWINGDYGWNRTSHTYVQSNGYWQKPSQGRTYRDGHWKSTPKGNSWSKGRWEKKQR